MEENVTQTLAEAFRPLIRIQRSKESRNEFSLDEQCNSCSLNSSNFEEYLKDLAEAQNFVQGVLNISEKVGIRVLQIAGIHAQEGKNRQVWELKKIVKKLSERDVSIPEKNLDEILHISNIVEMTAEKIEEVFVGMLCKRVDLQLAKNTIMECENELRKLMFRVVEK